MKWPWHRNGHDGRSQRDRAARELAAAKRLTPLIEQMAGALADLPPEELADRVRRALTVRRA